jgi:glycosyltransferase involved in cell wall biosynthesis
VIMSPAIQNPKMLFVDDELFFTKSYVEEVSRCFDVTVVDNALAAIKELESNSGEYAFASIDIMMPAPEGWRERTKDGLETGIEVLRVCRDSIIRSRLPILLLTNRAAPIVEELVRNLGFPEAQVVIRSKIDTPAFGFLHIVQKFLERQESQYSVGPQPKLGEIAKGIDALSSIQNKHLRKPPFLKKSFLAVATEWSSKHGGLSTFNREFCVALAREQHDVFCFVPDADEDEMKNAHSAGVSLIRAKRIPAMDPSSWLLQRPSLPNGRTPDFIIGHDRQTGPHAMVLSADMYPKSERIHFIHTAPAEIEWFKTVSPGCTASEKAEDRQREQVELCRTAQIVAAVGPRLHREIAQALYGAFDPEKILAFNPGLNTDGVVKPEGIPPAYQCLVLGRAEDRQLKGLDLAARAMALAYNKLRGELRRNTFDLVVRGVPDGEGDELRKWMQSKARNTAFRILPKNYSSDTQTLREDIKKASLVLMPSKAEGFGLVGLEAIGLGVPVLLSEQSGLAEALQALSEEHSCKHIAQVTGRLSDDAEVWSQRIAFALMDREASYKRAWELREKLIPHMNWQTSIRTLFHKLGLETG